MKMAIAFGAMITILHVSPSLASDCDKARENYIKAAWDTYTYMYTKEYIKDNKKGLENSANVAGEDYYKKCKKQPSNEQVILQESLNLLANPYQERLNYFTKVLGLPKPGSKTFTINIKDIEERGVCGGDHSFVRNTIGSVCN